MNFQKRSSAGQKRRTPFFPSLHTSYFIKQEAKYLVSKNENRLYSGFCTLLIFGVLSLVFCICATSFYFLEKYGLPTLTHSSQKLLFYTFSFCVLFFGFFICFALFCGLLRFAYNDEKERGEKNVLFAFYNKKAFGKVFSEYLMYLLSNVVISAFPIFCVMFTRANAKFDIASGIICTVFILTYLYLLCIINGVFVIMSCIDGDGRLLRAVSLFKGHICEFIFLNIRLVPSVLVSVMSLGVLHVLHTSPLVYASYACFASYADDVGKYGKILPKGTYTNEQ